MTNPIRVVVADDSPLLRRGIRVMLDSVSDIKVVGEAEDGQEAVTLAGSLTPDVVIMDVSMPHLNGLKATERIRSMGIDTQILILSMHNNATFVRRALRSGARGYVLKRSIANELLPALYRVSEGERYLSQMINGLALDDAEVDTAADGASSSE